MTHHNADSDPRLRGALFDLGDTLVRCEGPWPQMLEQAVRLCHEQLCDQRPDVSRDQLLRAAERSIAGRLAQVDEEHRTFPARERVVAVLNDMGIEAKPDLVERLVGSLYQPISECSRPLSHAREALAELKQAGLRLGLVSNTPWDVPGELVERDLVRFGLRAHFDVVIFSDGGFRKPHPDPFRRALAELGTTAAQTIMVGDSLTDDVAGAHALGMRTMWLAPPQAREELERSKVKPDYIAGDVREAGDMILALAKRET